MAQDIAFAETSIGVAGLKAKWETREAVRVHGAGCDYRPDFPAGNIPLRREAIR